MKVKPQVYTDAPTWAEIRRDPELLLVHPQFQTPTFDRLIKQHLHKPVSTLASMAHQAEELAANSISHLANTKLGKALAKINSQKEDLIRLELDEKLSIAEALYRKNLPNVAKALDKLDIPLDKLGRLLLKEKS